MTTPPAQGVQHSVTTPNCGHQLAKTHVEGRVRDGEPRLRAGEGRERSPPGWGSMRLKSAASCLREGVGETTTYLLDDFPSSTGAGPARTRLNRKIRGRMRSLGTFPDGRSAHARVRVSVTSSRASGRPAVISTCPGSVTVCSQRVDIVISDGRRRICANYRTQPHHLLDIFFFILKREILIINRTKTAKT